MWDDYQHSARSLYSQKGPEKYIHMEECGNGTLWVAMTLYDFVFNEVVNMQVSWEAQA